MVRILTLDGAEVAVVDKIQFVRAQENGAIVTCDPKSAQGIVAGGELYHLEGLPAFLGYDTVTYEEFSGSEYQQAYDILMGVTE